MKRENQISEAGSLTRQLAEFASGLEARQVPGQAIETAKRGFIDCVGVMFAGRDQPVARILLQEKLFSEKKEAHIHFDRGMASSPDAALLNGTAAHALDYDDVGINGHPSVVLVPALLAEGERLGAPGAELAAAYVAGYEIWAELSLRDADPHHGKGWHPTAVFGAVGAAAAAARLARLDAARTQNAIGIAASMAAGLVANFGSMTKPFQAGRAAQSGVTAARLAAAGMTASPDALEHKSGMLAAFSPRGNVRLDGAIAAGRDWHILRLGLNVKRYPVCYCLHRAIDGLLGLKASNGFSVESVKEIQLTIGKLQAEVLRHSRPQTGLDAKFSGEFAAASSVVAGRVGLAELTDDFVRSAPIQSLLPKVRISTVDASDPDEPLFAPSDSVKVTLADGRSLESGPVRYARGHAKNPIGLEELRDKFDDCVGAALDRTRSAALFERLAGLEKLSSATGLYS
jgi:2-methylcitrate dehydratase PrpD